MALISFKNINKVKDAGIREKADAVLRAMHGEDADYREGQYEAIEATLMHRRTLVVQKTGWGKSLVYFICAKILRNEGKGPTLVISPLLTLMKNQIEAAEKLGLSCEELKGKLDSETRNNTISKLRNNELDMLFITPETLFNMMSDMTDINFGLFVIDEAHCISDWGHDFRFEYSKLNRLIGNTMSSIPVLATTATANNRVIEDLEKQLGEDVFTLRGPLTRKSLSIQVLHMATKAEKYGWILENINKIEGSGIIYCLTRDDCNSLAEFLMNNGIEARSYHSKNSDEYIKNAEEDFRENKIKVLVATSKLGMGYDKGDVTFIIHYQCPPNIITYYQQIGRAGRSIDRAYTFLMYGERDKEIQDYFIENAFPEKWQAEAVLNCIKDAYPKEIKRTTLFARLNMPKRDIEKALSFLNNEDAIAVERDPLRYRATANIYEYNEEHYKEITDRRYAEQAQMEELIGTDECYSKFVVSCLDDNTAQPCGKCANCNPSEAFQKKVSKEYLNAAEAFIGAEKYIIEPRKKWAPNEAGGSKDISKGQVISEGLCLTRYGEQPYGEMVKDGKYGGEDRFCDELIEKAAETLRGFIWERGITHITYVPSLRSNIVKDFAERLGAALNMPVVTLLGKNEARPQQKEMENSSYQCDNARNSFRLCDNLSDGDIPDKILLVDDVVDSRWTFTACGEILLGKNTVLSGSEKDKNAVYKKSVYPFALAKSTKSEEDNA